MALEALVAYYRAFESGVPQMTTTVTLGAAAVGTATFNGRSTTAQQMQVPMPDLLKQVAAHGLAGAVDLAHRHRPGLLHGAAAVRSRPSRRRPSIAASGSSGATSGT